MISYYVLFKGGWIEISDEDNRENEPDDSQDEAKDDFASNWSGDEKSEFGTQQEKVNNKKHKVPRWFMILSDVASIILVVLVVFVVFSALDGRKRGGFAIGPVRMFDVLTGSMAPTIPEGSIVVTFAVSEAADLKIGDIITFMPAENATTMLTHRIRMRGNDPETFITRGDANNVDDSPVYIKNIVGKVLFHVPLIGFVIRASATTPGLIFIVSMFIAFCVLTELIKRAFKA